jgi:hypothetical protein
VLHRSQLLFVIDLVEGVEEAGLRAGAHTKDPIGRLFLLKSEGVWRVWHLFLVHHWWCSGGRSRASLLRLIGSQPLLILPDEVQLLNKYGFLIE